MAAAVPPPSIRHSLGRLLAAGILLLMLPAAAAQQPPPRVQDLHYGTVLFQFYQERHFDALTELLAAQTQQRFAHHGAEAELLRGGLKLSYGMHDEAERIFRRLLTRDVPADIRNRGWYFLARTTYEKGLYQQAAAALARIDGELDLALDGERQLLSALVLMAQQDYRAAIAALDPWRGRREDRPYADYNRAIALIHSGERAAGLELLGELGRLRANTPELEALRDKANMAAGYTLLQAERPEQAQAHLNRVRLEGPQSNQALLLAGMSASSAERHSDALLPWETLRERPTDDPAVQDVLLAIPQAHASLGDYGRAAGLFEQAITVLERERDRLGGIVTAIEAGELVAALELEEGLDEDNASRLPGHSYLIGLLAGHHFHQSFQNYLDLRALEANLEHWAGAIASFDHMLENQEARHRERLREFERRLDEQQGVLARRQHLLERLQAIQESGEILALATATEQRQWQELRELDQALTRLPLVVDPELEALQLRFWRLLRGFLGDLDGAFQPRLDALHGELATTTEAIAELRQRQAALIKQQRAAAARFAEFGERLEVKRVRIQQLQPRVTEAVAAHRHYLQQLALSELAIRHQRLEDQVLQARYALARVHDEAASNRGGRR